MDTRRAFLVMSIYLLLAIVVIETTAFDPKDIKRRNRVSRKTCKDRLEDCRYWASIGECDKNPGFMKRSCCLSCTNRPDCDACEDIQSLIVNASNKNAIDTATKTLNNCGAVVLTNVYDEALLERVRGALDDHLSSPASDQFRFGSEWFGDDPTKDARSEYLLPYASPFTDEYFVFEHTIVGILKSYLHDVRGLPGFYLEHSFVIRARGGSRVDQPKHQDNVFPGVVVQIPVSPIKTRDGPTVLFPCSHQGQAESTSTFEGKRFSFTVSDEAEEEDDVAVAPLGSVLMYVASVQHYGSANAHDGHDRDAIFLHFCKEGRSEPRPDISATKDQDKWRSHVFRKAAPNARGEL